MVGFLLGASFFSFIFVGTLYMQQVLGYSALKTGVAWLAASLTSVALAGLSQMLVTKTSAKMVMAAGMALIGMGVVWASQVPVHGHFWARLAGPSSWPAPAPPSPSYRSRSQHWPEWVRATPAWPRACSTRPNSSVGRSGSLSLRQLRRLALTHWRTWATARLPP